MSSTQVQATVATSQARSELSAAAADAEASAQYLAQAELDLARSMRRRSWIPTPWLLEEDASAISGAYDVYGGAESVWAMFRLYRR